MDHPDQWLLVKSYGFMPKWMVYETPINPEVVAYEIPMV